MVHSVTPILGFSDAMSDVTGYQDAVRGKVTPQLGTTVNASDGHQYVLAEASAAVASAGTVVILTEPGMTFATGAGAFTTKVANQAIGDRTWLQKTAI